jgi:membrane fusion protein (multidrug efflux system)
MFLGVGVYSPTPMLSLRLILAALLLLLWAGLPACSGDEEEGGDDDDSATGDDDDSAELEETAVRAAAVVEGTISEAIKTASTVQADKRADVVLETSGTVAALRAEEGDLVSAGRVLAVLKNPQVSADLERAEANFTKANDDFASVAGLFEQGYVARREFDEAKLAASTARATVDAAREAAESLRVKSPIRGTVSLRDIRYGEAVSPGRLAFGVVDLRDLLVEVNLPEKDLNRLRVGQEARITSELLEGKAASGRIARISPVIDAKTGTVKVTVAIDPTVQRVLPGMFVQLEIVVATHELALLIPKVALVYDDGAATVFRVSEGKASQVEIKKGFTGADQVEVLEGLKAGDQIVVAGQGLLQDGAAVRIVK